MPKPNRREYTPKYLGTAIKVRRESRALFGRDLAQSVGMNSSYLSQIERNREIPSETMLRAIAIELGTTVDKIHEYAFMIEEFQWV
ncbi:MAG: helix-turn-helix transcriptional regulator [bacterium]|nr:helix-turn-helix transcriptional regulator [bacterium]